MINKKYNALFIFITIIIILIMLNFFLIQSSRKVFQLERQVSLARYDISTYENRKWTLIHCIEECILQYNIEDSEAFYTWMVISNKDHDLIRAMEIINNTVEKYPEIKSDEYYNTLLDEISVIDIKIQKATDYYNIQVDNYNRYNERIMTKFFLKLLGYGKYELFV